MAGKLYFWPGDPDYLKVVLLSEALKIPPSPSIAAIQGGRSMDRVSGCESLCGTNQATGMSGFTSCYLRL